MREVDWQVPSIPWSGSFGGENDGPLTAELDEEVLASSLFGKLRRKFGMRHAAPAQMCAQTPMYAHAFECGV